MSADEGRCRGQVCREGRDAVEVELGHFAPQLSRQVGNRSLSTEHDQPFGANWARCNLNTVLAVNSVDAHNVERGAPMHREILVAVGGEHAQGSC